MPITHLTYLLALVRLWQLLAELAAGDGARKTVMAKLTKAPASSPAHVATVASVNNARQSNAQRQARFRARHGAEYRQRHAAYMCRWRAGKAAERQAAIG